MPAPVFLGDAVSAAGWRLAGMRAVVPEPGREAERFQELLPGAELMLLTVAVARALPEALLEKSLASVAPLVLVVPDVQGRAAPPDMAQQLKSQLGLGG